VPSIQQRPSGSFRVSFRVEGRQKSLTYASMKDARTASDLIDRLGPVAALAVLEAQASASDAMPTVSEYVRHHIAALDGITPGTRLDYERMTDRRIDTQPIGALPVNLVTTDHIRTWLAYLEGQGLSAKSRRNHHTLLSAAFTRAIEEQLRGTNPAKGMKIKSAAPDAGHVFLTENELTILVGATPARYQPLVLFLAGTGMRWGEATALLVGDVDLDATVPVVHVRRAWKRTGHGGLDTAPGAPKTRAGLRTVSLPHQLVAELRPLVDGRPADEYVFTAPRGGPVRSDHFHARAWGPTLRRLNARVDADGNKKIPDLGKKPRIHDLRHSHASSLLAQGLPLPVIQARLGHESIETTVGTYGHLAPDHLELAAAAAGAYLVQASPEVLALEA